MICVTDTICQIEAQYTNSLRGGVVEHLSAATTLVSLIQFQLKA